MTRAEKVARAQELRAEGMSMPKIAERMGVTDSAAWKWLNPETAREMMRRSNDQRGSARWYQPCACGARKQWGARECDACHRKRVAAAVEDTNLTLQALWNYGLTACEIGNALGIEAQSVRVRVSRLRSAGWDMEIRNHGSRAALLARWHGEEAA